MAIVSKLLILSKALSLRISFFPFIGERLKEQQQNHEHNSALENSFISLQLITGPF